MVMHKNLHNMYAANCLVCLDNGCSNCRETTMLKQAQQIARVVNYVQIKSEQDGGQLIKQHSNLFIYKEGNESIEFVANFGYPAVNGFVVRVDGDAPMYMTYAEFSRQYIGDNINVPE